VEEIGEFSGDIARNISTNYETITKMRKSRNKCSYIRKKFVVRREYRNKFIIAIVINK